MKSQSGQANAPEPINSLTPPGRGGKVRAMDPDETFQQLMEAYADGDRDRADELASDLHAWIRNGGYVPALSLTDRFNRPTLFPADQVRALIAMLRMMEADAPHRPGPSPLDG